MSLEGPGDHRSLRIQRAEISQPFPVAVPQFDPSHGPSKAADEESKKHPRKRQVEPDDVGASRTHEIRDSFVVAVDDPVFMMPHEFIDSLSKTLALERGPVRLMMEGIEFQPGNLEGVPETSAQCGLA